MQAQFREATSRGMSKRWHWEGITRRTELPASFAGARIQHLAHPADRGLDPQLDSLLAEFA